MIYRDIYRAIEWDGKCIMTNKVEALFYSMPSVRLDEVQASQRRSSAQFQTLLPRRSVTLIGIIPSLASLWRWHYWSAAPVVPVAPVVRPAPVESKSKGVWRFCPTCMWSVCAACLVVNDRRCKISCLKTPSVQLPTHPPPPPSPTPVHPLVKP